MEFKEFITFLGTKNLKKNISILPKYHGINYIQRSRDLFNI